MRILRRHDGLLVERLTLRARTCEFEPQLGQLVVAVFPKIVIMCLSTDFCQRTLTNVPVSMRTQ